MTPAPDGTPWPIISGRPPPTSPADRRPGHASIYLLHGLSEHAGRYDRLARWLTARGWVVGARRPPRPWPFQRAARHAGQEDDAGDRRRGPAAGLDPRAGPPTHSAGPQPGRAGGCADRAAAPGGTGRTGAQLAALRGARAALGATHADRMSRHTPDLRVPHAAPARISHDRAVVKAYRSDPLVRRSMTGRLARFVDEGGAARCAKPICCPAAPC